jgi:N-acetylglutamate synthase-like GNAT family acetyltransferase
MRPADLAGAVRVLTQWNMAPILPSPQVPSPERASISLENSFVAELGGEIVGVASYIVHTPELAETASHAVDQRYRGKGVGYLLQQARLREMKEKGIRMVRTETDRRETVEWLVGKFGFTIVGTNRKKHSFSVVGIDYWTVLELDLSRCTLG